MPMKNFYQDLIRELVSDVNPAGVEAVMRLEYGTLDHLPRETFAAEAKIAAAMEREEPGALRQLAASYGLAADFDQWEGIS
jgi:hypothetical protein